MERFVLALVGALVLSACGGDHVDLGHSQVPPAEADAAADTGPGELLFDFPEGRGGVIALDGQDLFFSVESSPNPTDRSSTLWTCKKNDCARTTRELGPQLPFSVQYLVAAGGMLVMVGQNSPGYGLSGGLLAACDEANCQAPTMLAPPMSGITGLAADSREVYWSNKDEDIVYHCSLPTCSEGPQIFAASSIPATMTLDETDVYWMQGLKAVRKSRTSTDPRGAIELGRAQSDFNEAEYFAVQNGWVYAYIGWCDSTVAPIPCGTDYSLWRYPIDIGDAGAPARVLVSAELRAFRVFGDDLFWTSWDPNIAEGGDDTTTPTLFRCAWADCAATSQVIGNIARSTVPSVSIPLTPAPVIVDEEFVYWMYSPADSHFDGPTQIRRVPRAVAP
jgi:hypothetical protein